MYCVSWPAMVGILGMDREALDRARISRDARFDGKFFIAVLTTRIYCRPICPAPTCKSINVRYYATAAEAAEAGFRPCLRCRPEAAPGTPAWLGTSAVVRTALRLIHDGYLDERSVADLAATLGVGPRQLNRLFAHHLGASPMMIAQTRRLQFAKRLLDETELPITEIALASGFGSVRRFNHCFLQTYRRAPRDLRRRRKDDAVACARQEVVLRFCYRPPYQWRHALDLLRVQALPGIERVDATSYARTIRLANSCAWIQAEFVRDAYCIEVRLQGVEPKALFGVCESVRRMFDLSADPASIEHLFARDGLLAPLIRARPGIRIVGSWDPFECAVRAVVQQQVSVATARTIAARLVAHAGTPFHAGVDGLSHVFPTPSELAATDLSAVGLTGSRAQTLHTLARAVLAQKVDWTASAQSITEALAAVPGIGRWTAQYVALFALGEPDAFPAADPVLRRACGCADAALTTSALEARSHAWQPWRGYAAMHLWAAAKLPRQHQPADPNAHLSVRRLEQAA